MDIGSVWAIFGSSIGVLGGIIGTYFPVKNAKMAERRFAIKYAISIWLAVILLIGLLLAPIFGYVRIKAKSVIAVSIIHGSFNANAGFSILLLKGGDDLIVGVTGMASFIVLLIINYIFLFDHSLRRPLNHGGD